jgi:glycosyltransferase involved in cell wall biosynthesis
VTLDDPSAPFLQAMPFPVHALGGPKRSFYSPRLVPWLQANRNRFDGVMLHGLWEYTSVAVLRAVAGHVPYVVFPHGMLDPYFKRASPLKHMKKWVYWLAVQYWTLRRAHRVLFTTTAERDLAAQSFWLHRWSAMVVALGAEEPPHDLAACAEAFFARCPTVRGKRYLLFLGRIDPKKGCDLLIEAFAAFDPIALDDPDLHLVMAGPDPALPVASIGPECSPATPSGEPSRPATPSSCPRTRRTSASPWWRHWLVASLCSSLNR